MNMINGAEKSGIIEDVYNDNMEISLVSQIQNRRKRNNELREKRALF